MVEPNRTKDGYGRYLSATSYFGPITLLAEYKDYWNFEYRYNAPPNAGRTIEAYDHKDVKGARLLVEGEIMTTGTVFYASFGEFNTHKQPGSPGGDEGDGQIEWYVAFEETAGPVYFEASYFDRDWQNRGVKESHIIADFHLATSRRGEVIVGYDQRLESASNFRMTTDRAFAAYSLAPWGTLSLRHAWTDESAAGAGQGDGTFDPPSGSASSTFTADHPGTCMVVAQQDGVSGSANVEIVGDPPRLTTIEISPASVELQLNRRVSLTATGTDQYGDGIELVNPQWSVSGTGNGTFDPAGGSATTVFEATELGTAQINCSEDGVEGTATVEISERVPPPPRRPGRRHKP